MMNSCHLKLTCDLTTLLYKHSKRQPPAQGRSLNQHPYHFSSSSRTHLAKVRILLKQQDTSKSGLWISADLGRSCCESFLNLLYFQILAHEDQNHLYSPCGFWVTWILSYKVLLFPGGSLLIFCVPRNDPHPLATFLLGNRRLKSSPWTWLFGAILEPGQSRSQWPPLAHS